MAGRDVGVTFGSGGGAAARDPLAKAPPQPPGEPVDRSGLGREGKPATGLDADGDFEVATAGGTFSLPVSLPGAPVRRDFEGPAERPTVTLWAVDARFIGSLFATGGVMLAGVIAWLVWQLWQELRWRRRKMPRHLVPAYAIAGVLMVAMTSIAGGIVLAAVLICAVELAHRLLARRAAAS
jgi:hypothetical protein